MRTVLSLFSGGGGLDLGFVSEGYDIVWAIDNNKNAVETYKANIGNHIICDDINNIDIDSLPHTDVVIGGPPCQSFSLAGNRNCDDARGQLVWKYIEVISKVRPKVFLFENVTGLLSAKNEKGQKILPLLSQAFEKIGYRINKQVVNAADYGVPQRRKRLIIVGMRDNIMFKFPRPTHSADGSDNLKLKKYVSVQDALSDLPAASKKEGTILEYNSSPQNEYQKKMRYDKGVTEQYIPRMSELDKYICKHVKPGGNYMDIPQNVNSRRIRRLQDEGGHTTCYGRMSPDKPSYTINTYFNRPNVGCNIHYSEERLITIREALRLQSFPDSYQLISNSKQGKLLIVGNAVPPMLGKAFAREIKKYL